MRRLPSFPARLTQLDLFVSAGCNIAARDSQDLMAWPFFSLAKSKRVRPIDFRMGEVSILVEATAEHGMATIWDADVLIWAASQIVEARDMGRPTSRLIAATPHEILTFTRRGTGKASYERLKSGLDRLQSTTIATSIRQLGSRRRHRFSWINEWKERLDGSGRALGIEMIVPDWFYEGVIDQALVLTIDPAYFALTGGLERWLYRLVRKHGGKQRGGWSFDFQHLHMKSGALSPPKRFAFELRDIVRRQALPGYLLTIEHAFGRERLSFAALPVDSFDAAILDTGPAFRRARRCSGGRIPQLRRRRAADLHSRFACPPERPLRARFGKPFAMIDLLPFWRVMAQFGAGLCGRSVAGGEGSGGWQDKSSAAGWGGGYWNCSTFSASHVSGLLAEFPEIVAFLPFSAPSPSRRPQVP